MEQTRFCPRPVTTRRYLQPPLSERLITLWAEGKLLFGDVRVDAEDSRVEPERYFKHFVGCGVLPLWGWSAVPFDFRRAENGVTASGAPIHTVRLQNDVLELEVEAFCNAARRATLFVRCTARNRTARPLTQKLSLLLRTGLEFDLAHGRSDGYVSYAPDAQSWKQMSCAWTGRGCRYTDGEHVLTLSRPADWNLKLGAAELLLELDGGGETAFTFTLDKGEVTQYDYAAERAACEAFWQKELSRIRRLPAALQNDPEKVKLLRHMTAQLLQMLAVSQGNDLVLPRQGGLRRIIWPTEALSMIEALSRLGDFDDYLAPVFSTYFDTLQLPSGEIGALGIPWASITAAVLYSFSKFCEQTRDAAFFGQYRDRAYRAYAFIRDLRRSVLDSDTLAGGLFPIRQGIDWTQQFQCWTSTDVFNLFALDAFAALLAQKGDPAAREVRDEHAAYLADMKRHFRPYYDAAPADELRIPLKPVGDDAELVRDLYPLLYHGRFILCGVIEGARDIERVYRFLVKNDITREGLGLYGHMRYADGNPNIWYVSFPDYYWFEIWMRLCDRERARQIVQAQLDYAMTAEYCLVERIDTADPYFAPWSPNASATGRTILMLLEFYAD